MVRRTARCTSGLHLFVLFGSRARGDAREESDWDFAYLGDASLDVDGLVAYLAEVLHADRIDLVDLRRAGGQLRYRVAREGVVVFADDASRYERFWLDAVSFWCDAEPVLREGYDRLLAELER